MARTTEKKAKRVRDGAEDAVYKPVRGTKKPIRTDAMKSESPPKPAVKKTAKKEKNPADKPAERRTPRKYEPLPKEDTPQQRRQKREKNLQSTWSPNLAVPAVWASVPAECWMLALPAAISFCRRWQTA